MSESLAGQAVLDSETCAAASFQHQQEVPARDSDHSLWALKPAQVAHILSALSCPHIPRDARQGLLEFSDPLELLRVALNLPPQGDRACMRAVHPCMRVCGWRESAKGNGAIFGALQFPIKRHISCKVKVACLGLPFDPQHLPVFSTTHPFSSPVQRGNHWGNLRRLWENPALHGTPLPKGES